MMMDSEICDFESILTDGDTCWSSHLPVSSVRCPHHRLRHHSLETGCLIVAPTSVYHRKLNMVSLWTMKAGPTTINRLCHAKMQFNGILEKQNKITNLSVLFPQKLPLKIECI